MSDPAVTEPKGKPAVSAVEPPAPGEAAETAAAGSPVDAASAEPLSPGPAPVHYGRLSRILPFLKRETAASIETNILEVYVKATSMSIRYKIAAALVAVLCLAIASLGIVSFNQQAKVLEGEMRKRAEGLVRQLAAAGKTGLLTKDELAVFTVLKDVKELPEVAFGMVLDSKGVVFAHNNQSWKGLSLTDDAAKRALAAEELLFQHSVSGASRILEAALPITSKLGKKALRVGTARVGISQDALVAAIRRQKVSYIAITSAFVMLGLLIALALGKLLTQRILVLAMGMKIVAHGNFDRLMDVGARDEIGHLAETFNQMILSLREKLQMERYLSTSTLQAIRKVRDAGPLKLGGERRHVAVLFSDVRGFTAMSERLAAEEIVEILNLYLNLQAEVVYQHGGAVDKFVGDEVMAIFTGDAPEEAAARAAVEIHYCVESLNRARARAGKRKVEIGIGLNSGSVVMGNIGSVRQMDYTVIGDPINAAARLCSIAKPGQVVISQAVAEALGAKAKLRPLGALSVKGKKDAVESFELLDIPGAARRHMRREVSLPASYLLAGLADEPNPAMLLNLSQEGCLVSTILAIGIGTQLELRVELPALPELAKVQTVARHLAKEAGLYKVSLVFEGLSEEAQGRITEWVHSIESASAAVTLTSASDSENAGLFTL